MHSAKKILAAGTPVRVEVDAQIIGLVEKDNPYWYEVQFADGRRETVSVGRISSYADRVSALFEADGSVSLLVSRLNAAGALDLFHWLRTHLGELTEAAATAPVPSTAGEEREEA